MKKLTADDLKTIYTNPEKENQAIVTRKVSDRLNFLPEKIKNQFNSFFVEIRDADKKFVIENPDITEISIVKLDLLNFDQSDDVIYTREEFLNAPKSSKYPMKSIHDGSLYNLYALNWRKE